MNTRKAQGSLEYILLIAGVMMIVILVITVLLGTANKTNNSIAEGVNAYTNFTNISRILG